MKQLNNKNGITLVALVITIIILLILAGITIAQLTGSGLFENARLAEEEYKNAQEKEDETLADYENKIGLYMSNREDVLYDESIYDVWPTWLSLAGIENPKQYNMQKILSNESLMETVMNSEKATEYMLNSREFIFPRVLETEVATTKLYESSKLVTVPKLQANSDSIIYETWYGVDAEYPIYNAFDQNDATWIGTAGASIGSYVGYDFRKTSKCI